ncbi:MAG: hypothetical protein AAB270_05350 [Chloroflexota bacterium]
MAQELQVLLPQPLHCAQVALQGSFLRARGQPAVAVHHLRLGIAEGVGEEKVQVAPGQVGLHPPGAILS